MGGSGRSAEREFLAFLRESLSPELPGTGRMPHATRVALIDGALRNYCQFGAALRTRYQARQSELLNTRSTEQRASSGPTTAPPPCPSASSASLTRSGNVDVAFVIDTTSSMDDDIAAAQTAIGQIIDAVFRTASSVRIALIEYRDADPDEPDPFQAQVDMPFTNDREAFAQAVNQLSVDGGGDDPESVYAGLMAAFALDWRPGAAKLAIPIGDAPAKNPEPGTGHTAEKVLQTARDLDPVVIYPILIGDDPAAATSFAELALGSNGEVIPAQDADDIVAAIVYAIDEGVARAVEQAPPGEPSSQVPWALLIATGLVIALGLVVLIIVLRTRRRRSLPG
jgi:Mg-chelatase subunit ChlD